MKPSDTCPTCGQVLPQARGRRICSDCAKPIRRHDKWHIGSDGKLHHNNCEQPEGYPVMRETMELLEESLGQ
ncbi:MAG: hypothetical protein ACLQLH_03390 [Terracidiphilus sp.]